MGKAVDAGRIVFLDVVLPGIEDSFPFTYLKGSRLPFCLGLPWPFVFFKVLPVFAKVLFSKDLCTF